MSTVTLFPVGDGLTTNWQDQSAGTTNLYQAVDEGTASPNDSDYVTTTTSSSNITFLLTDIPVDFISASSLTISLRNNDTDSKSPRQISEVQIVESDDTTAITDTSTTSSDIIIATYTYTPAITGTNNKTSWNGARLRLKTSLIGSGNANVHAVQVALVYSNVHTGSGGSLGGGTASVSKINVNTASGGVLAAGTGTSSRFVIPSVSGGALVGGSIVISNYERGSGGVILNGGSDSLYDVIGSGGALVGGSLLLPGNVFTDTGSGGVLIPTQFIPRQLTYAPIVSGGVIVMGSVEPYSEGGVTVGGSAINYEYCSETGSAGVGVGGDVLLPESTSGGVLAGGDPSILFTYNVVPENGVSINGTFNLQGLYFITALNGVIVGSSGVVRSEYQSSVTGGVLAAGTASVALVSTVSGSGGALAAGTGTFRLIYRFTGSNGALVGGTTYGIVTTIASGGLRASGSASYHTVMSNFIASGSVKVAGLAGVYTQMYNPVTSGVLAGGTNVNNIEFISLGGVLISGLNVNTLYIQKSTSGGVVLSTEAPVGVITVRLTDTSNSSVILSGSAVPTYSLIRNFHQDECVIATPCTNEEFDSLPMPTNYIPPYSTCKKMVVLRGGRVAGSTVCNMSFKVRKLVSENKNKIKTPSQQEQEKVTEIA